MAESTLPNNNLLYVVKIASVMPDFGLPKLSTPLIVSERGARLGTLPILRCFPSSVARDVSVFYHVVLFILSIKGKVTPMFL